MNDEYIYILNIQKLRYWTSGYRSSCGYIMVPIISGVNVYIRTKPFLLLVFIITII
jgi:hypothetical protein